MKKREEITTNSKQVVETQIMEFILDIVQSYFNVGEDYYRSSNRKYDIVLPRQIAMYLIRKHTSLTLSDIGVKFGNKDHATVLHGVRKVKGYMDVDKELKNQVADIEKIVKFKNKAVTENMNLNKDYYYIDLNNFISMKVLGDKSIILTGFTDDEVSDFSQTIKALIETKQHDNTGMYIFEKREENGEEN